jgi:hypothetical protein
MTRCYGGPDIVEYKFVVSYSVDDRGSVIHWLSNNMNCEDYLIGFGEVVWFRKHRDALIFKLKWG